MSRCPACAYLFGPRDGAPESIEQPFSQDVRCPECGLPIPAGSRVVVGSSSAYAVGAKLAWKTAWPFVFLAGVAVVFWIPKIVGAFMRWMSGGEAPSWSSWMLLVGLAGWVMGAIGFMHMRRARKQRGGASEEAIAPHERVLVARGWLFVPGWLVVFNRAARLHGCEAVDARLVRSVRARICVESGEGVSAACEVSARLLPPGAPAAFPVHVRFDGAAGSLAAALDASLRIPARADYSEQLAAWNTTDGAAGTRIRFRRPDAGTAPVPRAAIEWLDDGRAVIVRGSPAEVAPVPAEAMSRSVWLLLLAPIFGLLIGVLIVSGGRFTGAPLMILVMTAVCGVSLVGFIVIPWRRKNRGYAEQAEWHISSTGIVIVRGRTTTPIDASMVHALELVEASGVPQLVIRATRARDAYATLVPNNWARLAPQTVLERIHSALRGTTSPVRS